MVICAAGHGRGEEGRRYSEAVRSGRGETDAVGKAEWARLAAGSEDPPVFDDVRQAAEPAP